MFIRSKHVNIWVFSLTLILGLEMFDHRVHAQIDRKINIPLTIDHIVPSSPCGNRTPCWLLKKGASIVDLTNNADPSIIEAFSYYRRINAFNDAPTLDSFKLKNHFTGANPSQDIKALYFNNGDLQLGREMHCNQRNIGLLNARIACYVSNYGPKPFPIGSVDNGVVYPNAAQALAELGTIAANPTSSTNPHPFATVAMESLSPAPSPVTVTVREADGVTYNTSPPKFCAANYNGNLPPTQMDVDTGVDIESGDTITFDATGEIWTGYCFHGNNTADGLPWTEDGNNDYPLPSANDSALIGSIGGPGGTPYFNIGSHFVDKYQGRPGRLYLRTNDNAPGNGNGSFSVSIRVQRERVRFYIYVQNAAHPAEDDLSLSAALDEEGAKSFPQMCMACHGGDYDPSQHMANGASFLPFDVFSFLFSQQNGLTLDDQQEEFRQLNLLVRNTNPNPDNPDQPYHPDPAIRNLIDSLYAGHVDVSQTRATLPQAPASWQAHAAAYTGFYAHYCRTCHSALTDPSEQVRGLDFEDVNNLVSSGFQGDVCNGIMPHAEVPYKAMAANNIAPDTINDLRDLGLVCTKSTLLSPLKR